MPERHRRNHLKLAEPSVIIPRLDPEIVDVIFSASTGLTLDEVIEHVTPSEAHILRAAQLYAQTLRDRGADPGDAFIEGIGRILEAQRRDEQVKAQIASLPPAA